MKTHNRHLLQNKLDEQKILQIALAISCLIPMIYLIVKPYRDVARIYAILLVLLFGTAVGLLVMTFRAPELLSRWLMKFRELPIWLVWGAGLVFLICVFRIAASLVDTSGTPIEVTPFYLWGIGLFLIVIWATRDKAKQQMVILQTEASLHDRVLFALLFLGLNLVNSAFRLWAFGVGVSPDTYWYIRTWDTLSDVGQDTTLVTVPYPLLNAIFDTTSTPWRMVTIQILLGAFAVWLIVYVLSRKSLTLAGAVGFLLAIGASWANTHRLIVTESVYTSAFVISFAILLNHYYNRDRLSWWKIALAGVLYGVTALIRPSGLYFVLIIIAAYVVFITTWRKTVLVVIGIAVVFAGGILFNYKAGDNLTLVPNRNTGAFVTYPLFEYGLFDPDNGPASQKMAALIMDCYGSIDLAEEDLLFVNNDPGVQACFGEHSVGRAEFYAWGAEAYTEAIQARPLRFAQVILQKNDIVLGHLGQTEGNYIWRGSDYCFFEWCPGASYVEFRLSLDKSDLYNQIIAYPSQLYMALVPGEYVQDTIPSSGNFAATASLIALVGFLLIMTSESERFVILGATGFILYSTLVMVAGHVYLPRYTIPISPFHSILSGVAIAIFFQIFAAVRLEGLGHLRRTHPRAFQTAGYCVVTAAIIGSVYLIARAQTPPELYATGPVIDAEEYLAQQIPDAVVYNPQSDNLRWRDTSIFLDESTLSDDDLENLGRWKSTLLPGYLKVVGIDYVAVDQIWFWYRADDDGDPALLENENYYELEQTFSEMFGWGTDQIHLYRVIGQETEATGN